MEGDVIVVYLDKRYCFISIHSLRVEGDDNVPSPSGIPDNFNPLPPCGGRLVDVKSDFVGTEHFNPLPPCGGRPEP